MTTPNCRIELGHRESLERYEMSMLNSLLDALGFHERIIILLQQMHQGVRMTMISISLHARRSMKQARYLAGQTLVHTDG